jgi:hypothetical protein
MLLAAFLAALATSLGLAYLKDMLNGTVKFERELKSMLPANVPLLAVVPQLQAASDRRSAVRFAVIAVVITLIGCALEAGLFLKLHPIL